MAAAGPRLCPLLVLVSVLCWPGLLAQSEHDATVGCRPLTTSADPSAGDAAVGGCALPVTRHAPPGCTVSGGRPDLLFPYCCPRTVCDACFSARHGRRFSPGDRWTDEDCAELTCVVSPLGAAAERRQCPPAGEPPFADCEPRGLDVKRGNHPRCCAGYRCPGRCQADGRWFSIGEQWDDGCTRAICIGTDHVERLACPVLRPDPARPDCHVIPGNSTASYPACCPSLHCDQQCDTAGQQWTEPGCVRAECREGGDGAPPTVHRQHCAPRPFPDCYRVAPHAAAAEFPACCPTYRCPGRCHWPLRDRWFSVGERWTEPGCILSECEDTAQVRQQPCGFISVRRPGCHVVEGDASAEYPACCRRVQCTEEP